MTLEELQRTLRAYLSTPAVPTLGRVEVARLGHELATAINVALDGDRAAERAAERVRLAHERGDCDE